MENHDDYIINLHLIITKNKYFLFLILKFIHEIMKEKNLKMKKKELKVMFL